MSEAAPPPGGVIRPGKAFNTYVGPFYERTGGDALRRGFLADERHANKRGVVHGGMLATAFDVALGDASWHAAGEHPCATVQLNVQFTAAMNLGEFGEIEVEIVRATRSLVFLRGVLRVGDRVVATAEGVWKVLVWREGR